MMRKEIIVASKVFDLGFKGLEEATNSCRTVGQEMELEVAGTIFQVSTVSEEKAIVFHQVGETCLRNVIWMRFIALRAKWPPVKVLSCFTYF